MLPSSICIMWQTYAPANFEVAMSNGSGEDALTRKYIIWPWPQGQGHMKCCLVPSTSCDLCTGKIWSCYFQKFMRRCVYKKIHYLTFDLDLGVKVTHQGHTKRHPVPLTSLTSCYFQKFMGRCVYNKKKKFDLWPWPWGQGHTKRHPVPLTSCDLCTGKIWSCYFQKFMRRCIYKKIHYLTFDLGVKVTENAAQYP